VKPYGHLSRIDVRVGEMVKRNQVTGLADGVQVNPREWWDAHWIQDRILSKIGTP
jgi:hypothetical protein